MSAEPVLDTRPGVEPLRRLLGCERGSALPLHELAALADLPPEWGITVDFTASAQLGCALVVVRPPRGPAHLDPIARLSRREREVAALVASGRSNKEIAAGLHIALGTVKDHVHRMLEKTGLPNRTALALAVRNSASLGKGEGRGQSIFG